MNIKYISFLSLFFNIFSLFLPVSGFLNIKFGLPFQISKKEYHQPIEWKHTIREKKDIQIINNINGFFGMIGPDVNISSVNSLFELFTGNGNIQGIFFDNGNLTYIKHYIRTEKLIYEEENGHTPINCIAMALFHILYKLNIFPNMLGLANTALLNINNNIYALFERDNPYLIKIHFNNRTVETIQKLNFKDNSLNHFSGHSKYNNNKIDTIHYDVLNKCVHYYSLNTEFKVLHKSIIKMEYLPIIHDFLLLNNSIIITDSPVMVDIHKLLKLKLPVTFYKNKKTNMYIINNNEYINNRNKILYKKVEYDKGFYIFHYADYKETDEHIEIYASLYDDIDFSNLNVKGNYRKIIIDKKTNKMTIEKNPELEIYDLDFPIRVKDSNKIILRNIHNFSINGFIICKDLTIVNKILFDDLSICGEPALIYIEKTPYLLTFAYNNNTNYILIIDIDTLQVIRLEISLKHDQKINIGFHSTFINS